MRGYADGSAQAVTAEYTPIRRRNGFNNIVSAHNIHIVNAVDAEFFARIKLICKRFAKLFNRYMIIVQIKDILPRHSSFYADHKRAALAAQ